MKIVRSAEGHLAIDLTDFVQRLVAIKVNNIVESRAASNPAFANYLLGADDFLIEISKALQLATQTFLREETAAQN